ncbi:nuclear transport factor 2 family protein [Blastococcus sp. SYSU DS0552]
MTADREALLRSLYDAFDARDIETVVAAMTPDVDWPDGWQGGRLVGRDAVGQYWERQWAEIRPNLRPTAVSERGDGSVEVGVRQVFRDPGGLVLERSDVRHVYTFDGHLVRRMDVER